MTRRTGALLLALLMAGPASRGDDELERHLADQRAKVADRERPMAQRERLALDLAATIDRAAQAEPTVERRLARWAEAAAVLEDFDTANPNHPQADAFALQAAVYHWARGRSLKELSDLDPSDPKPRERALDAFTAAVDRLRSMESRKLADESLLAQNIRYRLALALADQARTRGGDADPTIPFEQALAHLKRARSNLALRGYAELLRAELLAEVGRFDEAQSALDAATRANPEPTPGEVARIKVAILVGQKKFDAAIAAIRAAKVPEPERAVLEVRARLAERDQAAGDVAKREAEARAIAAAQTARNATAPEARLALIELARTVQDPDPKLAPDAYDTLAEGARLLGDPARASKLEGQGAERAEAQGDAAKARAFRFRAGAILFQADRFAQAEPWLRQVADDPGAGSLRPRANLLRILALGRGLAAREAWATPEAYRAALERHVRDFADDPTTPEARWLLGRVLLDAGRRNDAVAQWEAIPREHARWLDARLALGILLRHDVEVQAISAEADGLRRAIAAARAFLEKERSQADDPIVAAEFRLQEAELDLLPAVGRPEEAQRICEDLIQSVSRADQRERARQWLVVAEAETGRDIEAFRDWQSVAPAARPAELLAMARRLDRFAQASDSDLIRRRVGQMLRRVTEALVARRDALSPNDEAEARLRRIRAAYYAGDPATARREMGGWAVPHGPITEEMLRDVAETYLWLGLDRLAVDAYRVLLKRRQNGTLPWFEARYGLALALERSGEGKEAQRLIDATEILHPGLGGGALKERFERLRQKINGG